MTLREKIEAALRLRGDREPGEAEAILAALDDLTQAARRLLDEPDEDAEAALDAALDPWETDS